MPAEYETRKHQTQNPNYLQAREFPVFKHLCFLLNSPLGVIKILPTV
jgi:hypothetical protein